MYLSMLFRAVVTGAWISRLSWWAVETYWTPLVITPYAHGRPIPGVVRTGIIGNYPQKAGVQTCMYVAVVHRTVGSKKKRLGTSPQSFMDTAIRHSTSIS